MVKLKGLRQINPYVAGQQPNEPDMIKLNTNENAYGPSPKVAETLQSFEAQELRRYSSLDQTELCQALAANLGVSPDQLIIGNGVTTSCPWPSWLSLTVAGRSYFFRT